MSHILIGCGLNEWERILSGCTCHDLNFIIDFLFCILLNINSKYRWHLWTLIRKNPKNLNLIRANLFKFRNWYLSWGRIYGYEIFILIKREPSLLNKSRIFPDWNSAKRCCWELCDCKLLVSRTCLKRKVRSFL